MFVCLYFTDITQPALVAGVLDLYAFGLLIRVHDVLVALIPHKPRIDLIDGGLVIVEQLACVLNLNQGLILVAIFTGVLDIVAVSIALG